MGFTVFTVQKPFLVGAADVSQSVFRLPAFFVFIPEDDGIVLAIVLCELCVEIHGSANDRVLEQNIPVFDLSP